MVHNIIYHRQNLLEFNYVFRLTHPVFIIIFSNTTYFDQADHHQVLYSYKYLKLNLIQHLLGYSIKKFHLMYGNEYHKI
jgi:hypothetical protein